MANRIAIPLHDAEGRLVGYAGRIIDDQLIDEETPKYRLPGVRERDGKVFEFSKGAFLFNGHRIRSPVDELVIVEGFFDAIWLHQAGWRNVVALMGASCSPEQAMLIFRMTHFDARIRIMTDGDEAGDRCAKSIFEEIAPERFVNWVQLDPGKDPAQYDPEALHEFLDLPVR
jgi:DNA primase